MSDLVRTGDDDLRVGDAERRAVDERLRDAVGEGLLTLGEYDERAAALWASRTRADLRRLTRDLPPPAAAARPVLPAPVGAVRRGGRRRRRWCWGLAATGAAALFLLPAGGAVVGVVPVEGVSVAPGDLVPPPPQDVAPLDPLAPVERIPGSAQDQTVFLQPGAVYEVAPGTGEVTLVVPDGVHVDLQAAPGTGEVECEEACAVVSGQVVRVVVAPRTGDVEIESVSEHD